VDGAEIDEVVRRCGATLLAGRLRSAAGVVLLESTDEIGDAAAGCLAVLTRRASAEVAGYRLDVALRRATDAGAVAVAVYGLRELDAASAAIALRGGVAVYGLADDVDAVALAVEVDRELRPGAASAFDDVVRAHVAIERAAADGVPAILEAAADATATRYRVWPSSLHAGGEEPHVSSDRRGMVESIVAALAERSIARAQARSRRADELAFQTRSQLLLDLLGASSDRADAVADRASRLGIEGGWSQVVRVDVPEQPDDPLARHELLQALLRAARGQLERERWLAAGSEGGLVLAHLSREAPESLRREVEVLLAELGRAAGSNLRAGIGGARRGLASVRASYVEARSALAASGPDRSVVVFDAAGVRRILVDWLATERAETSMRELLGGLDDLGEARARELVRTLKIYLDEQGSPARAARRLHLHPNAVRYRIRQLEAALDCDLGDPDQRLALHIAACATLELDQVN